MKSELNPTGRGYIENSSFRKCKWGDIYVANEKKTLVVYAIGHLLNSAQEDESLIALTLKASNEITLVIRNFNFLGIQRKSNEASGSEEKCLECIQDSFFSQHVLLPTRRCNTLDLIMSNDEGLVAS